MAAKSKDIYGQYGVYGSLAYDFKSSPTLHKDDYCIVHEKKAKINRKKKKSPAFVVSCLLTGALLLSALMARSSMVIIAEEIQTLRNNVEIMLDEQTKLKISHEKAFPLEQTESYAINVLGMQKPMPYQIIYVDVAIESEEKVIDNTNSKKGNLFSILREYFPLWL